MPTKNRLLNGDSELVLYGDVGDMWGDGSGFQALEVMDALEQLDGDITIRINSGGGLAAEGVAIFNAITDYEGGIVNVSVDAIAASAASLIAMAGDTIKMRRGSLMMIHDPAGMTIGPAEAHEATAGILNKMADTIAGIYANKADISLEEMREHMKSELWLDDTDAVEMGFADTHEQGQQNDDDDAGAVAFTPFDYASYHEAPKRLNMRQRDLPKPAASPPNQTEQPMPKTTDRTPAPTMQAPPTEPAAVDTDAVVAEAAKMAVDATNSILAHCAKVGLDLKQSQDILAKSAGDENAAKGLIIDAVAARDEASRDTPRSPATVTIDSRTKFAEGIKQALLHRVGLNGGEQNQFSSMSLREMARKSLEEANVNIGSMGSMEMVGEAFTMASPGHHGTDDFPSVLADVAHKAMLKGFTENEESYRRFTSTGSLPDFKTLNRVDTGLYPNLALVEEGADYEFATMSDRGVTLAVATYGSMFAITRQAIINDDINAFSNIPRKMGAAASRTVGNLVWGVITTNGNMGDGNPLFDAAHSNVGTGAISVANIDAGRTIMATQTDPDNIAEGGLNIRPAYMLVPTALRGLAVSTIEAEMDPSVASGRHPNYVRNIAEVIDDARLDADSTAQWYLAANPAMTDTLEVSYLDGNANPFMEQRLGWSVDGTEFKVRIDAGVTPLDWRGLYRSSGV